MHAGEGGHHAQRRPRRSKAYVRATRRTPTCRPADEPSHPSDADLDVDPVLRRGGARDRGARAEAGWDQPARLFALVDTAELVGREPELAAAMGLDEARRDGSLTPVEQDDAARRTSRSSRCWSQIIWPADVAGCAAVVERLVLPPEADAADARRPAARRRRTPREHPDRAGGADRRRRDRAAGSTYCALRLRPTTTRESVVGSARPGARAAELLRATLVTTRRTNEQP